MASYIIMYEVLGTGYLAIVGKNWALKNGLV